MDKKDTSLLFLLIIWMGVAGYLGFTLGRGVNAQKIKQQEQTIEKLKEEGLSTMEEFKELYTECVEHGDQY